MSSLSYKDNGSKTKNAIFAILLGLAAPALYTVKAYVIRTCSADYNPWDLGIDALVFEKLCYTIMYLAAIHFYGYKNTDLFWGSIVGVLLATGKQSICLAYDEGPGGVVNTMLCTMSIYQILLAYFIDHQKIYKYGLWGVIVGLIGTILIALGNKILRAIMSQETIDKSPASLRRFI